MPASVNSAQLVRAEVLPAILDYDGLPPDSGLMCRYEVDKLEIVLPIVEVMPALRRQFRRPMFWAYVGTILVASNWMIPFIWIRNGGHWVWVWVVIFIIGLEAGGLLLGVIIRAGREIVLRADLEELVSEQQNLTQRCNTREICGVRCNVFDQLVVTCKPTGGKTLKLVMLSGRDPCELKWIERTLRKWLGECAKHPDFVISKV